MHLPPTEELLLLSLGFELTHFQGKFTGYQRKVPGQNWRDNSGKHVYQWMSKHIAPASPLGYRLYTTHDNVVIGIFATLDESLAALDAKSHPVNLLRRSV